MRQGIKYTQFIHKLTQATSSTQASRRLLWLPALIAILWQGLLLPALAAPAPGAASQFSGPAGGGQVATRPAAEVNPAPGHLAWTAALTATAGQAPAQAEDGGEPVCPAVEATAVTSPLVDSFLSVAGSMADTLLAEAELTERVNILLLGSDSRPGEKYGHTDTIILVTIDPISHTAGMLSIPRDLWVSIPGYGENRINQAYRFGEIEGYPGGGPALMRATLEANLGLPVHYYALVDFEGFKQLVDTLGGIDVCVPEMIDAAAYYGYTPQAIYKTGYYSYVPEPAVEPAQDGQPGTVEVTPVAVQPSAGPVVIEEAGTPEPLGGYRFLYIEAGLHHLDGEAALRYARSRASVTADFARVRQQQAVLLAMKERALQIGILPQLPDLWLTMQDTVSTDLQLTSLLQLAHLAQQLGPDQIQTGAISHDQTINYKTSSGAQVLLPRRPEIQALINQMFGSTTPTAGLTQLELEAAQAGLISLEVSPAASEPSIAQVRPVDSNQ